jgi:23S rRNA pseudouridine1911/1915/1917 synthase
VLALPPERIVHVDGDVVVIDKPAGISSVPFDADEHDSAVQRLTGALRRLEGRAGPPPRVVHRLDKDTSGLLVFARSRAAERSLAAQFRVHAVHRRYLALCHGSLTSRTISSVLVADRGDGLRGTWRGRGRAPEGRQAVTHVRVLASHAAAATTRATTVSWVACRLETGRTHQIRIHLAEAGHPVVGESVYVRELEDPGLVWPPGADGARLERRQLLHAAELGFVHPGTDHAMRFTSPLPDDFVAWQRHLGTASLEIPADLGPPSLPPDDAIAKGFAVDDPPVEAAPTRGRGPARPSGRGRPRAPRSSGRNNDR